MIEVTSHADLRDPALVAEWEALADLDPASTIFHRPDYLACWRDVFGGNLVVRVLVVRDTGRPLGVIPVATQVVGSIGGPAELRRFLGGTEVTDYLGPVSRPEDRVRVATALADHLREDSRWDEFALTRLAEDSGWAEALDEAMRTAGFRVIERDVDGVCPRVDLTGGYEAHLERLPGRLRQELVRKTRKLARDAGDLEVVEVVAGDLHPGIDEFLAQVRQSFPDKAGFFARDEVARWFHALADALADRRAFRLHRLDVGGITAAMTVSLVHRDEWGLYNSSFDPTLAGLAPGFVLVGRLIELAAAEGRTTFDLLWGDEAYKYRFGAVDRTLRRATVLRSVP